VLVGSGEFTEAMAEVDEELLTGQPRRLVALPIAAAGEGVAAWEEWATRAEAHAARLGAEAVVPPVRNRQEAQDRRLARHVGGGGLVYLSGGRPCYLCDVLRGSVLWEAVVEALRQGSVLAGSSAGAEAMGALGYDVESEDLPTCEGLGVLPDAVVVPHFDAWTACDPGLVDRLVARAPDHRIIGVDEDTALIGGAGRRWWVRGRGQARMRPPGGDWRLCERRDSNPQALADTGT
jgi:cyanophycinase-like exopeptidase